MAVSASRRLPANNSPSAITLPGGVLPFQTPSSGLDQTTANALPTRRCHLSTTPTPCSPSRSASPAGTRTPEPSSINGILRENNRDRLFVCPLQWTSQHLLLLGFQFRKTVRCKSKTKNTGSRAPDGALLTKSITCAVNDLLHAYSSELKTLSVRRLLQAYGIHHSNSDLSIRFAQCIVATLQTDGVFSCSSSSLDAPTLAYLDLGATASRRNMTIKMPRTRTVPNPPVARLQQIRTRRLQPTNELEDPYIAAVLIALAQGRRHGQDTSTTLEYKVHLLALPATNARTAPSHLYFYTALIPQAFLDRFDYPSRYSPCDPILISYCRIPLKPFAEMMRAMGCVFSAVSNSTTLCNNSELADISF
ncbi:hypothetical protein B0T21DRAFT_181905 [Apiosordaria backusii]|uniref:Uncharacterized protein n=1 Tax=Apiosordaria backusii TaxID=314023 RepID=A0AA40EFK7_9PEZI|nr:hypothetical protein B0T21DRAFT_181905 [Apiosordaria backusii]